MNNQLQPISIDSLVIRQDSSGLYFLNDLHKASGGLSNHAPEEWDKREITGPLIEELQKDAKVLIRPLLSSVGGIDGGLYACKELVYAYAMWVGSRFHLKVIMAFDRPATQDVSSSETMNTQLQALHSNDQLTMSSLEIAELTGKRHADVIRDINKMIEVLNERKSALVGAYIDKKGEKRLCFNLPKDLTLTLITGYSIPLRHKINQRWMELEAMPKQTVPALPNFADPAEAAIAWATQYRAAQEATQQLALAAPKVERYTNLMDTDGLLSIKQAGSKFGMTSQQLGKFLQDEAGWLDKRATRPSAAGVNKEAITKGYMETKMRNSPHASWQSFPQNFITSSGMDKLFDLLSI